MTYTLPLQDLRRSDLARAGGKGANLGELLTAGLPVPPGFCVLTGAYREFVSTNRLEGAITRACAGVDLARPDTLEAASTAIQAGFAGGQIPERLVDDVRTAYAELGRAPGLLPEAGGPAVAVRSSATAEDLPDLSFAGQQDTYLNVVGEEALMKAVVRCWASLWTARAIGYRARNGIDHSGVSLAVVVQAMAASDAAGVLFTANPQSGVRAETVIDATLGLGEALVAGKVEPDHYVIRDGQIATKTLGAKAISIRGQIGGGTGTVSEDAGARQALPDAAILELAGLGRRAAEHFGAPQDVEWSWAGEKLWLVQSRPITSLFPLPEHHRGPGHLLTLFNVGTFQGMMDPITPLGRDVFFYLGPALARLFGSDWTHETQTILYEIAERLFLDLNGALRSPFGRRVLPVFLGAAEPGSVDALRPYLDDPRLAVRAGKMSLRTRFRLMRILGPNLARVLLNLAFPDLRRQRIQQRIDQILGEVRAERLKATSAVSFTETLFNTMARRIFFWLITLVASGQVAYQLFRRMVEGLPDGERRGLEVMRGLAHNVTTEMDLVLWQTAQAIRADPQAAEYLKKSSVEELAADYQAGKMIPAAQQALAGFLEVYGVRGLAEIDLGRKRWREDPRPVLHTLQSYLEIDRPGAAPDVVFARGAEAAEKTIRELCAELRRTPGGWWRAPAARWLAGRARALAGLREAPKFTIVRLFGEVRTALLAEGTQWARDGWLSQAGDICFLRIAEIKELEVESKASLTGEQAGAARARWLSRAAGRKAAYARELKRRQAPRLVMGDGYTVYEGAKGRVEKKDGMLVGEPVSPGQAEGVVHVVLDPNGVRLAPGEILVCPGTDPSWTPLFLAAGGLVMEVGGLLTHGSVVAREYGIPAVVGVGACTLRLTTGMRVRVDGTAGTVTILQENH